MDLGEGDPTGQTPAEARCGAAAEAPVGWEDVDCYDQGLTTPITLCFGFRGIYYSGWGLYPTCDLEEDIAQDPEWTEIAPADAFCN